jgi:hypothetical protein
MSRPARQPLERLCHTHERAELLSHDFQHAGRTPPMAASVPGQNIVPARSPCRIAVTHSGSPPHQRPSFAVSDDCVKRSGIEASRIVLPTMP